LFETHSFINLILTERLLFEKFKRQKGGYDNWTGLWIKHEDFAGDVALLLNEVEAFEMGAAYGIECEMFSHPRKYLGWGTSSFAYQKNFALKEVLDYHLQKFMQSGLLEHLAKKYLKKITPECTPPLRELSFKATFFPFAILAVGTACAMTSFLAEKIVPRFKN